ncbi:hypothetical protein MED297_04487 [Reinekea sp. MED297]|uniref:Uncharacterized protein n=1 Tax=Reinekea blandensis MED297 TaxID=314283 RepID=A4BGA2_9GAMM|nr:hypothetical protein MED297_04487 [Reinekea sp. MED297] [Reinekea blandensis MED297]
MKMNIKYIGVRVWVSQITLTLKQISGEVTINKEWLVQARLKPLSRRAFDSLSFAPAQKRYANKGNF